MQQGCCDVYGLSVDKSLMMPPLELLHSSGDEDCSKDRSPPTSCENSTMEEPKAKKRRKQSNPLRYATAREVEDEVALDLQTTKAEGAKCGHCSSVFASEDSLRLHVEEEHVQKVLERQLQQQHNKTTSGEKDHLKNNEPPPSEETNSNSSKPFPPFPPMPPFIPFSRSGEQMPLFPNPMAPFLFPQLLPNTPPASNGAGSTGARIFNLEAYCELCNKEFCNKYFLKTHKANKHGIYSMETMVSSPYPFPPLPLPPPPHLMQEQQRFNTESFCEICQKEFCNKYFLKKHRHKIHGIVEPGQSPTSQETSKSDSPPAITTAAPPCPTAPPPLPSLPPPPPPLPPSSGEEPGTKAEFPSLFNLQQHQQQQQKLQPAVSSDGEIASHVFTPEKLREMGVINADAFCELCCKEFCNKYFLRTHKLNKHGINMPDTSPHKSGQDGKEQDEGRIPEELLQEPPPGLAFEGELSCEFCNRPFSSLYLLKMHKFYTHNVPYIKEEEGPPSKSPDKDFAKPHLPPLPPPCSEEAASQDLQKLQTMIRELNASAGSDKISCNLCRLEFDNKYFLRAHMMNEHGVLPNEEGEAKSSGEDSEAYCEICQKEFCSKYFLKTHRQNIHGLPVDMSGGPKKSLADEVCQIKTIVNNTVSLPPPPASTTPPLSLSMNATMSTPNVNSLSAPMNVAPLSLSAPLNAPQTAPLSAPVSVPVITSHVQITSSSLVSSVPSPPHLHQNKLHNHLPGLPPHPLSDKPRQLTGRNYCNICNKELCNKYFMKTHMLKMHGINLDSQPHEAARISTIGGVQCDICQKELCSKYFLKVHKQNTHGIFEEGATKEHPPFPLGPDKEAQGLDLSVEGRYQLSPYPEVCPICSCRFKSAKWLKAHMVSDHGHKEVVHEDCLCVLCGQGFPEKVALHVHLIKEHQQANEVDLQQQQQPQQQPQQQQQQQQQQKPEPEQRVNGTASPQAKTAPHGGSRIYHCSFCVYSTRWLSNLYAHEKRHTGVNTEGEKKFVCRICHRAYRYNHSLQRHFLSHRGLPVAAPPKVKRYRCSKCSRKFRTRELCLAHIHALHGKRLARPFRCRFCGFATRAWNVLKIHISRQHHGETPPDKPKAPPSPQPPPPPNSPHFPMTFAMPQNPPQAGSFIMQPFLLAQPDCDGGVSRNGTFVPSLVYLPVCQKVSQPVTVAFTLTPA